MLAGMGHCCSSRNDGVILRHVKTSNNAAAAAAAAADDDDDERFQRGPRSSRSEVDGRANQIRGRTHGQLSAHLPV